MITIEPVATERRRDEFVGLPGRLHRRGSYEPAVATERRLLAGTHPLSDTLALRCWTATSGGDTTGRIGLTAYPDDPATGYVGFLEAADPGIAAALFETAAEAAAAQGRTRLVGPVNGSFWLRYRLKVSGFDERPYFGEPLNPPEHVRLWEGAGFVETDHYRSAFYRRPDEATAADRFSAREELFARRGFEIRAPRPDEWDRLLRDLYDLLTELYATLPAYRPIGFEAFRGLYGPMRAIADFSMVRMAYREGRAEGFLVAFPDYGLGLASDSTARRVASLLRHRRRSDRYVLLYLGVRHPGLGSALMRSFGAEIVRRRAELVGALTHVTKASGGYAADLIRHRNDYLLLARDL